jgi:preprotein translocase subunit SecG
VIINALKPLLLFVFMLSNQSSEISILGRKHSSAFKQNGKESLAFRKVIFAHISFFNYCFVFCFFANTVFQAQF